MCHLGFILEFSAVGIGQLRRVAFVSSTWKLANLTKSTSPVPHCNQGPADRCFLDLGGFGSGVEKNTEFGYPLDTGFYIMKLSLIL